MQLKNPILLNSHTCALYSELPSNTETMENLYLFVKTNCEWLNDKKIKKKPRVSVRNMIFTWKFSYLENTLNNKSLKEQAKQNNIYNVYCICHKKAFYNPEETKNNMKLGENLLPNQACFLPKAERSHPPTNLHFGGLSNILVQVCYGLWRLN